MPPGSIMSHWRRKRRKTACAFHRWDPSSTIFDRRTDRAAGGLTTIDLGMRRARPPTRSSGNTPSAQGRDGGDGPDGAVRAMVGGLGNFQL